MHRSSSFRSFAFLLLLVAACGAKEQDDPAVKPSAETRRATTAGDVIGFVEANGAHVWRGVPFAGDTGGAARWQPPQPAQRWQGLRDGTVFGPACPQIATPFTVIEGFENGKVGGREDCLNLDIYAPPSAKGQSLPVMVWVHGGSNVSGASRLYQAHNLAINENVVVMAVQYRLGPLGFFSHPAVRDTATTPAGEAANFAILDLVAALQWVQDNAASFGGDPTNVTLFGESAGGQNIASLLVSPLARGLFHRAILQSAVIDSVPVSEAEGREGERPNPSNAVVDALGGPEALRTASVEDVFAAYDVRDGLWMDLPQTIEDGVSLPSMPLLQALGDEAHRASVPIVTGSNKDEMKLFMAFDDARTKTVLGVFRTPRNKERYNAVSDYAARLWRARSVDGLAATVDDDQGPPLYAYRFDWDEGGRFLFSDLGTLIGAAHSMEIPFVFNRFRLMGDLDSILFGKATRASRETLSRDMGAYWAGFARTGVPQAEGLPTWPGYSPGEQLMVFDSEQGGGTRVVRGGESLPQIISDLRTDERFSSQERCKLAQELAFLSGGLEGADDLAALCGVSP